MGALPREATRGHAFLNNIEKDKKREERHGAIDRKRGVKTPTKA
jgi:hypothetical protein